MKKIKKIFAVLIAVLFISVLGGFAPPKATVPLAIIVNKENPVASLSAGEVKLYWLRKIKSRWPAINKNIRPVDHKTHCVEQETFYSFLGMNNDEVETYFVTKQYQNAQKPQDKFVSDKDIIDFVADEIGAIGYVNLNNLSAESKSKVKVVFTLGSQ